MPEKRKTDIGEELKRLLQRPDVRRFLESQGVNLEEADKQFRARTKGPEGLHRRIQAAMSKVTFPGPR